MHEAMNLTPPYYAMVLLASIFAIQLSAQDHTIRFQSGDVPSAAIQPPGQAPENDSLLARSFYAGHYYLVLQFHSIPSADTLQAIAAAGVELFDYIPNYAYLAKAPTEVEFDLPGIRGMAVYEALYKLPQSLAAGDYPGHAYRDGALSLLLYPWPGEDPASLQAALAAQGFPAGLASGDAVPISIPDSLLLELAAHPGIRYVGLPEPEPEPEGITGRNALRLNLLNQGNGIGLDGAGVSIAIGDDGRVAHEDFRGRLFDHTATNLGEHGDMTAGLAIGAGNIDPQGMGMAPGATLHLYDISGYPHITNARAYYQQYGTVLTSTSYSEGCGGLYTTTSRDIDRQAVQQPELLHIFSAGNSAYSACSPTYGGIQEADGTRYGNITGGRKAAKNVMAVANLYFNDNRVQSSSRGPAEDGRIKPDISAYGQGAFTTAGNNNYQQGGGTSAAAPSIAGAAAALVQAYRQHSNGANPPAALLKACLLNTADDLGRRGPDYDFGWGRLHAGRALETIVQGRHFSGQAANGSQDTYLLSIPAGVKEARVMLCWQDHEGAPMAARALVNDLDLRLAAPNGSTYRPWVLSTHAHIDSLTTPAYRGSDHVNNVEQVTLDNPAAGLYTIRASGYLLGQSPQPYYVVYTFIRDEIAVTYPAGGEHFTPGETEVIRWDAYGDNGNFTIQYSVNDGQTWSTLSNSVPGTARYYSWVVPAVAGGQGRIRVLRGSQSGISESRFSIIGRPDFQVGAGAGNAARVSWAPVPGANQYDVYTLGQYAMEIVASTSALFIDLPAVAGQKQWYSVRARNGNQAIGQRAVARDYTFYPCAAAVTLTLRFDYYPGETSWQITNDAGDVLLAGGPYPGQPIGSTMSVQGCLPYGCFDFTIFDSYQNGMCCNTGAGSYELRDADGNILAAGGQFGASQATPFCLNNNVAPLQAYVGSLSHVSCFGAGNGSATIVAQGGSGSYAYRWSHGPATATAGGLGAGLYSVTVSDGQAQVQLNVRIDEPAPLTAGLTITNPTCQGAANGRILASASGGTNPYNYAWSHGPSGPLADGLNPGAYQLTLTDANGCTTIKTTVLGATHPLMLSIQGEDVSCAGANDGRAMAHLSGGSGNYSLSWSHGPGTALVENLAAGTYRLEVSSQAGCSAAAEVEIQEPAPLQVQVQASPASNGNGGAASLFTTGGGPPYQYLWQNGLTASQATGLAPGSYSVTVTDARACTAQLQFTIEDGAPFPCDSRGISARYEWIESFQLGAFCHTSGNNDGHGDFSQADSLSIPARSGQAYSVSLAPGFDGVSFYEHWRIWADFNQDGDFLDQGEALFAPPISSDTVRGSITLPGGLLPGAYRLRLAMQYGGIPSPCANVPYGEVEDYSLLVMADSLSYCYSGGQSTGSEWIEEVRIGNLGNLSGNDGGYGNYTDKLVLAAPGEEVHFFLKPGSNGGPFPESWRLWADFNQDGDFDGHGELLYSRQSSPDILSGSFIVPRDAAAGLSRLRVSMKFGPLPNPCEPFTWGEAEDYGLMISSSQRNRSGSPDGPRPGLASGVALPAGENPVFYPNPAAGQLFTRVHLPGRGSVRIALYSAAGRLKLEKRLQLEAGRQDIPLDIGHLPKGPYFVQLSTDEGQWAAVVQVAK